MLKYRDSVVLAFSLPNLIIQVVSLWLWNSYQHLEWVKFKYWYKSTLWRRVLLFMQIFITVTSVNSFTSTGKGVYYALWAPSFLITSLCESPWPTSVSIRDFDLNQLFTTISHARLPNLLVNYLYLNLRLGMSSTSSSESNVSHQHEPMVFRDRILGNIGEPLDPDWWDTYISQEHGDEEQDLSEVTNDVSLSAEAGTGTTTLVPVVSWFSPAMSHRILISGPGIWYKCHCHWSGSPAEGRFYHRYAGINWYVKRMDHQYQARSNILIITPAWFNRLFRYKFVNQFSDRSTVWLLLVASILAWYVCKVLE